MKPGKIYPWHALLPRGTLLYVGKDTTRVVPLKFKFWITNNNSIVSFRFYQHPIVSSLLLPQQIAFYLALGYHEAADIGRFYNFDRVFCVAPTATSFTKHFDSQGFSITPEISPPLSRSIERSSETFGSQFFHFHPNVQIASHVGWDTQWRLLNIWQRLMDSTGLSHSISANIWDTCPVDESFIDTFLASDLKTTYYRLATLQSSNDKSRVISDEALDALSYLPNSQFLSDVNFDGLFDSSDVVACNLDSQYCPACAGD